MLSSCLLRYSNTLPGGDTLNNTCVSSILSRHKQYCPNCPAIINVLEHRDHTSDARWLNSQKVSRNSSSRDWRKTLAWSQNHIEKWNCNFSLCYLAAPAPRAGWEFGGKGCRSRETSCYRCSPADTRPPQGQLSQNQNHMMYEQLFWTISNIQK